MNDGTSTTPRQYAPDPIANGHPAFYAETVRVIGYDPHHGQFVGTPRDSKTGRFVARPAVTR